MTVALDLRNPKYSGEQTKPEDLPGGMVCDGLAVSALKLKNPGAYSSTWIFHVKINAELEQLLYFWEQLF